MMKTRQMALCGLLTALAVVMMVLCGAIGIGTYAGPILAMVALLPVLEEYGSKSALTVYMATALVGLLLVPELELALVFTALGWYPVVRPRIARLPSRALRVLTRIALCSGISLLLYGVLMRVLGMTADLLTATPLLKALLLICGNILFLVSDVLLGRLTLLWRWKLRRRFFR